MFFLEPFLSRRESSPSVSIPCNLFTQRYLFTLPLACCFLCASVTCRRYLPPSQSVSAATSCFLTSVENIKQHPSIQEITLCSQILNKDSPYRVKDYQLPSCSFLAKKIVHYKPQRRCGTLNSARHFTSVVPTSVGDFSSCFFFLHCPEKVHIPGFREEILGNYGLYQGRVKTLLCLIK